MVIDEQNLLFLVKSTIEKSFEEGLKIAMDALLTEGWNAETHQNEKDYKLQIIMRDFKNKISKSSDKDLVSGLRKSYSGKVITDKKKTKPAKPKQKDW